MEGVQKCGYLEVKEPSCIKGRKLKVLNFMIFIVCIFKKKNYHIYKLMKSKWPLTLVSYHSFCMSCLHDQMLGDGTPDCFFFFYIQVRTEGSNYDWLHLTFYCLRIKLFVIHMYTCTTIKWMLHQSCINGPKFPFQNKRNISNK